MYIYILVFAGTIALFSLLVVRKKFKRQLERIDAEISDALSSHDLYCQEIEEKKPEDREYCDLYDIEDVLSCRFKGHIITQAEGKNITNHFSEIYNEVYSFRRKLQFFYLEPTEQMSKLIDDFTSINRLIKEHNETTTRERLEESRDFFDSCLAYPLDEQQRRSIISEEENCLVVSSAGSGKTSSIVGKVKYLIEKKGIKPQKILLISYTNKAAAELTERMGIPGLRGYTFHKLALDIIGQVTGRKPSIYENTDTLFVKIYRELLADSKFQKAVVKYFVDYQIKEDEWEKRKNERRQTLSELKNARLKALLPDMDGNTVYVKSEQEQKICFVLSSLGVKYRYEEAYEHHVADEMHSQYKPDFSIYYEKDGCLCRVYLEHFGVDEHGLVPAWFAKDKNITYDEANQKYGDGITWKREVHAKYGTTLITTSSADFQYFDMREKIMKILNNIGVPTELKSDEELYDMVLPKDSKQEKAFIRLAVTFATLLKSSCKTIQDVMRKVDDERSEFIIKHIFQPVYERYSKELQKSNQIDFTDAILWATQLCKSERPVSYDYIIVDEFQDISVDRYAFLKALREGQSPAKLYCVGDDWQSIYRFSGSDMSLFNQFADYFGPTEIHKIETTYRFGEPLVGLSSRFIQRNKAQISKNIRPFNKQVKTELHFYAYDRANYNKTIEQLVASIPAEKSIFLLGRYSFDDYYLSFTYKSIKESNRYYYIIGGRKIEFLTVHKSKGLEADYVIILQCNKDTYGFPSGVSDDPVLDYVLTNSDQFPYGEERRLFYVAITRAKLMTMVLYDKRFPSVFVNEFLHPESITEVSYAKHPNANKRWTRNADEFLLALHREGKSIKYIAEKMGRSQTSIVMRLGKLKAD